MKNIKRIAALLTIAVLCLAAIIGGNHTSIQSTSGATTSPIDATGATLLVTVIATNGASACTAGNITDSQSNTYTCIADSANAAQHVAIWYVCGPSVSAALTWTTHGGAFPLVLGRAYSGTATVSCFDTHNEGNNGGGGATVQPGSVTPSQANSLFVTGMSCVVGGSGCGASPAYTIDSGFTVIEQQGNTIGEGGGYADIVQVGTTALNPTWGNLGTSSVSAAIAVFKPAAGGTSAIHHKVTQ